MKKTITPTYITETDMERLENLIKSIRESNDGRSKNDLRALESELEDADVVLSEEIPSDIVTMRSKVRLEDLDSGERPTYTIVFPTEANSENGQISILAPLAAAVLGHRVGETIEFQAPTRARRIIIEDILYQPESTGDYTL